MVGGEIPKRILAEASSSVQSNDRDALVRRQLWRVSFTANVAQLVGMKARTEQVFLVGGANKVGACAHWHWVLSVCDCVRIVGGLDIVPKEIAFGFHSFFLNSESGSSGQQILALAGMEEARRGRMPRAFLENAIREIDDRMPQTRICVGVRRDFRSLTTRSGSSAELRSAVAKANDRTFQWFAHLSRTEYL
jgi:hypothetical protein